MPPLKNAFPPQRWKRKEHERERKSASKRNGGIRALQEFTTLILRGDLQDYR